MYRWATYRLAGEAPAGWPPAWPYVLRPIEGKPVVVQAFDDNPTIHVGDQISAVDGKTVDQIFLDYQPLISVSTRGALNARSRDQAGFAAPRGNAQ